MRQRVICIAARFSSSQPDPSEPTFYLFLAGNLPSTSQHGNMVLRDERIWREELTKALGKPPKNYKSFLVAGGGEPPSCQELMRDQP